MSLIEESKLGVDYLTVESTFGPTKGFINKDYPKVAQFLGIPFAEAPTGPRRWLPPVPKAAPPTIDATRFGLSCPQWTKGPATVYNSEVTEFQIRDEMDEDCLSISIWTPATAAKSPSTAKLPVIVWITGGGFIYGGSTVPYQNPTPWVENSQRHIVVCINYRMTIFGFPNAAGLPADQQNLGLLDQRLGLEWVHQHIASFGGDPSRLTHFGQSSGACSVDMHAFQYPDKPLVRGLIMHSGVAHVWPTMARPDPEHKFFSFVAKELGFEGGDAAAELEFMRKQPAAKLLEVIGQQSNTGKEPFLSFVPILDDISAFHNYEELAQAGNFSKLPAIIGTNEDEGNSAVLPYNPEGLDTAAAEMITQYGFLKPSISATSARLSHAPTFRYLYKDPAPAGTSSFSNISPKPFLRTYHSSELPLVFGTHSWFRGPSTEREEKVSRAWQELYVRFAEDGPEGLRNLGWKDAGEGGAIVIGVGENGWEPVKLEEIEGLSNNSQ